MSINIEQQILITRLALEMISDIHEQKNRLLYPHANRTGLSQSQVFDLLEGLDPLFPYYFKKYTLVTTADTSGSFNWTFLTEYTTDSREELSACRSQAEQAAAYLAGKLFLDEMPDYIKVYRACAFLSGFLTFRNDAEKSPHILNAYGALIQGVCSCQGYAHALKLLLKSANIPCIMISGSVRKDNTQFSSGRFEHNLRTKTTRHYWNLVGIETPGGLEYFHVDACWGQQDKNMGFDFFLKDDHYMQQFLKWEEKSYPVCKVLPGIDIEKLIKAG